MECRKCLRSYKYLLSHLKGTCRTAYQKEELEKMRKEARRQTHKKAHAKRYSPTTRHQRYVSSKNPQLKPKSHNATNVTHTQFTKNNTQRAHMEKTDQNHIPAQPRSSSQEMPPPKMTILEYAMHKGFEKFTKLVNKEIKRNNSSLLPEKQ